MLSISFNDAPDIVVGVTLDDTVYRLRLMWNPDHAFWVLHLWDKDENPLLTSVKVVPNFPLLFNKHCFSVPRGELMAVSKQLRLDRDAFKDGRATLLYLKEEEWGK